MRTLDEVIESMQLTSDVNRNYREENADVLHYLVEYRACQQHMEVVEQIRQDAVRQRDAHIKALGDLNRNDLLSWDELRENLGKPVWNSRSREWMLFEGFSDSGKLARFQLTGCARVFFSETEIMKYPLYRKERPSGGPLIPEPRSVRLGEDTKITWHSPEEAI